MKQMSKACAAAALHEPEVQHEGRCEAAKCKHKAKAHLSVVDVLGERLQLVARVVHLHEIRLQQHLHLFAFCKTRMCEDELELD